MPDYDPTHMPHTEIKEPAPTVIGDEPAGAWKRNPAIADPYSGPPASREYETAGATFKRSAPPAVPPATSDASSVMPSVSPPPGHTAQP